VLQPQRTDRIAEGWELSDEVLGAAWAKYLSQPAITRSTFDSVEIGRPERGVERLNARGSEATRLQQRRQAGRVVFDKPGMGAHPAGAEELGDQRLQRRTDTGDLTQAAAGSELFE